MHRSTRTQDQALGKQAADRGSDIMTCAPTILARGWVGHQGKHQALEQRRRRQHLQVQEDAASHRYKHHHRIV
jgi:hypothetical protein